MSSASVRRIDVFFYGLFMDAALLREKGVNPQNSRLAAVDDFQLVIGERATLIPSSGVTSYGVVFSLTHEQIELLYADASVGSYRPEAVIAKLFLGGSIPALCFNLPKPPAIDERNPIYAAKLKTLADRLGLPANYVAAIS